jgi:hypothetical protein
MWFPHLGNGQVYNYESIRFYNRETNPSVLTSTKNKSLFTLVQKNSLSNDKPFSYTSASYSSHLGSNFWGVGLTLNNTHQGKDASYRYAGIGVGYRNVVLSKVLVKVGATYKTIHSSEGGDFGYYKNNDVQIPKGSQLTDKLNFSVSVTENAERYYFSLSALNFDLPWSLSGQDLEFSRYYIVSVGDLGALLDGIPFKEISYGAMGRYDVEKEKWLLSHYLNLKYQLPVTRKLTLFLGLRSGYLEQTDIDIRPFVTAFTERFAFNLVYNFHLDDSNFNVSKTSTIQTTLILTL